PRPRLRPRAVAAGARARPRRSGPLHRELSRLLPGHHPRHPPGPRDPRSGAGEPGGDLRGDRVGRPHPGRDRPGSSGARGSLRRGAQPLPLPSQGRRGDGEVRSARGVPAGAVRGRLADLRPRADRARRRARPGLPLDGRLDRPVGHRLRRLRRPVPRRDRLSGYASPQLVDHSYAEGRTAVETRTARQWSVFYAYTAWSVVLIQAIFPLGVLLAFGTPVPALLAEAPAATAVLIVQMVVGAWSGHRALALWSAAALPEARDRWDL